MSRDYDVIIVGGGIAGLTSAAYLSREGLKTLLLEKGPATGGLVRTFHHRGFAFDAGIRAFENSGIVFPMLISLDIELDVVTNPVSIGIKDRWTALGSGDSLSRYGDMLRALFPAETRGIGQITKEIRRVMQYMDVLYGIDNPLFLEDMNDPKYLLKTLLPWLVRYKLNIGKAMRLDEPVNDYLLRFTENQALIDMITQHFFRDTPTFFALSYFGLYQDYSYPLGGMGTLAAKLTEFITDHGGQIRTDTEVTDLDHRSRHVTTRRGETFGYQKLIWAADQKRLYAALPDTVSAPIDAQRKLAGAGEGGDSILTLYLGVELDPSYFAERCGAHAFYTPLTDGLSSMDPWQDVTGGGEDLNQWTREYLAKTTYEISCPALRDATLAPAGQTGVIVSTLMDYRLVRSFSDSGSYEEFKARCTDAVLKALEGSVFPGIIEKTLFTVCATPLTIERETGNAHGAITGWAFTNSQMPAEDRFVKIAESLKTPIPDVCQCGQWSFSPSGLPVSILTGKMAADAVKKDLAGPKR